MANFFFFGFGKNMAFVRHISSKNIQVFSIKNIFNVITNFIFKYYKIVSFYIRK